MNKSNLLFTNNSSITTKIILITQKQQIYTTSQYFN